MHPSRSPCVRHWWGEDVEAFYAELDAITGTARDPASVLADTDTAICEFLERKKKLVADTQEVIVLHVLNVQISESSPP
jgi:hypothetical protein